MKINLSEQPMSKAPEIFEQVEDVLIHYQGISYKNNAQVLLMGKMKAHYTNEPTKNHKGLYPYADFTFRFHGKDILQLSMFPKDVYRIKLGNFKPYNFLLNTSRLQSANGKNRVHLKGVGSCKAQEWRWVESESKMLP